MIFVDTSFWVALRFPRDEHHAEARRLFETHGHAVMLTTNLVRGETWTFLRGRVGHRSAVHAVDAMGQSPRLDVVRITDELENKALAWLHRHDERSYSFVDATSFEVMRDRRITQALAFDADFSAAGFVELRS